MFLFGYKEHKEKPYNQLEITENINPHMRWHPFREEWVTYSAGRKNRTSFPPKEYCPLCPGANLKFPTEIPFKNFEIAVFPNRWSSFSPSGEKIGINKIITKPSKGECEVVVYSSDHSSTVAQMTIDRVELLIHTWIDRYKELQKKDGVKYIMPFENRGEECGVTLHHPHGQIYAYPFIPEVIKKEIKIFNEGNFLLKIMSDLEKKYCVYQNDDFIAYVPPFARYAYELWIMPKKQYAGPWKLNNKEIKSFAMCLQKIVTGYDKFLNKKCPYIMGIHSSPSLEDDKFHFHIEFYPPLRHGDKPKVLAGSESLAGVFIMDVLPEYSASKLREFME